MKAFRYGGFFRRLAAFWIDGFLLNTIIIFSILAAKQILAALPVANAAPLPPSVVTIVYSCGALLMNMSYFTYFHAAGGQTPGKRILGLKVIRITGKELTPGIAFIRWLGYLVSRLFLFLGFLWIAVDRRKQGWHDKIAGTLVIRTGVHHQARDYSPPHDSATVAAGQEERRHCSQSP